ncbi:hypothetical protein [Alkalibacterium sp. 20]|uniref:hypothetical protein n=1 Tax=Alkalibacterium sp. 20 TaxID=1798803 RepID=UPI000A58362E|nr:hypothetical protein [Alkalibacterium sp. 20]
MVREENYAKTYRLSTTVIKEIDKLIKENGIRTTNDLFEQLISSYKEVQTTSYKKTKKESDLLSKDLSIIKKDLAALLYLNGNMGEFLSLSEINDIDHNSLINQSKDKVKRDIEKNQVKKAFDTK